MKRWTSLDLTVLVVLALADLVALPARVLLEACSCRRRRQRIDHLLARHALGLRRGESCHQAVTDARTVVRGDGAGRLGRRLPAWALFAAGCAAVSLSQDLAFEVSYFLRQRGLMRVTMSAAGCLFLLALVDRFLFVSRSWRPAVWIPFTLGLGALTAEILGAGNPAEAFHCVEFFALAVLAYRALLVDVGAIGASISTFAAVAAFGLLDEVLQGFNPPRRFDWNDVFLNARVALESVLLLAGLSLAAFGHTASQERHRDVYSPPE